MGDPAVLAELERRHPGLRMSFDEFLHSGEDVHGDWIDGTVHLLEPDTPQHNGTVTFLMSLLSLTAGEGPRGQVLSRFQMRAAPELPSREVDLLYLRPANRHRLREYFVDGPADLVMEVVSESTRATDFGAKLDEYGRGGVDEYRVVDPAREQVVVAQRGDDGRMRATRADGRRSTRLRSAVLPNFWIEAEWLWADPTPTLRSVIREWGLL